MVVLSENNDDMFAMVVYSSVPKVSHMAGANQVKPAESSRAPVSGCSVALSSGEKMRMNGIKLSLVHWCFVGIITGHEFF
jgi:hypothetical protein